MILFEAIAIGVAEALDAGKVIKPAKLRALLDNKELAVLTTGATNSRKKLNERIAYVKDNV
ncbi:hypothetical protein D3C71_2076880 [compost metagenome]